MLDPERRLLGVTPRGPLSLPPGGATGTRSCGSATRIRRRSSRPTGGLRVARRACGETGSGPTDGARRLLAGRGDDLRARARSGRPRPAALVALSGFMPTVPGFELDLEQPLPPVAIGHGDLRPGDLGRVEPAGARRLLEEAGADVLYREYPLPHAVDPSFLAELAPWLASRYTTARPASGSRAAGARGSRPARRGRAGPSRPGSAARRRATTAKPRIIHHVAQRQSGTGWLRLHETGRLLLACRPRPGAARRAGSPAQRSPRSTGRRSRSPGSRAAGAASRPPRARRRSRAAQRRRAGCRRAAVRAACGSPEAAGRRSSGRRSWSGRSSNSAEGGSIPFTTGTFAVL